MNKIKHRNKIKFLIDSDDKEMIAMLTVNDEYCSSTTEESEENQTEFPLKDYGKICKI